mgnify:CR=1 FL=1
MPYSTATDARIFYETSGDGPPLVFVHANPFDHRLWSFQIARFSAYYKVVAVDIRGYGRSDKPETEFSLADMKADVLGVCAAEGISQAIFCGCSVGSGIALLTLLDHPEMIDAAILVGGNSRGSTNVQKRVDGFLNATDLRAFIQGYLGELVAPGFLDKPLGAWVLKTFTENANNNLSARSIAQIHRARGACDMSDRLAGITKPVLVINGAPDNSLEAGTRTASMVPGCRHVVLPDTGHACCIEDPVAFDEAMIQFLRDNNLWHGVTD